MSTQSPQGHTDRLLSKRELISTFLRWLVFAGVILVTLLIYPQLSFEARQTGFLLMLAGAMIAGVVALQREAHSPIVLWHQFLASPWAPRVNRVLWLLSGAFMFWAAIELRPSYRFTADLGLMLATTGIITCGAACILSTRLHPATAVTRNLSSRVPVRWRSIGAGVILVAFVLQINVVAGGIERSIIDGTLKAIPSWLQFILFFSGTALFTWGLGGGTRGWRQIISRDDQPAQVRWQWVALVGILLIAALMRLWNLELWITRWLDEIHYAWAVTRLWDQGPQAILTPFSDLTAFTWAYPFLQAITASILGPSFTGLRLISAFFGIAQVVAVYLLGETLFNRRTALIVALLMATFPAHLQFSRIGIANIADPVFGTLTLAFLLRGMRYGRQMDYALAGACLGLTHYFYEGGRLFYTPFVILLIGWFLVFARRSAGFALPGAHRLLIMAAAAGVLIIPLYYTWWTQDIALAPRLDAMQYREMISVDDARGFIEQPQDLQTRFENTLNRIDQPIRGLMQLPDTSWFYGGQQAFILLPLVPFFLLGLAISLWRIRHPAYGLMFWWLVAGLVGNALIADPLSAPRYLVIFPVLCLLIAVGIQEFFAQMLWHPMLRWRIIALVTLFLAGVQGLYYFGVHLPNYYNDQYYNEFVDGQRAPDTEDAMLRAVSLPIGTVAHIISPNVIWSFDATVISHYFRRGHDGDLEIIHIFPEDLTDDYLADQSRYLNHAFFLMPADGESFARIASLFVLDRDIGLSWYPLPDDRQMWLYFAPRLASLGPEDGVSIGGASE